MDSPTAPRTIAWIDDDVHAQSAEVHLLRLEGFQLITARTGTDGLALVRSMAIRLVLLDLRLPDIDGLTALETLRHERIWTPVLVVTGYGDFEAARRAGALGAVGFEAKPILAERLIDLVKRFALTSARVSDAVPPVVEGQEQLQQLLAEFGAIAAGDVPEPAPSREIDGRAAAVVGHAGPLLEVLLKAVVHLDLPIQSVLLCFEAFANALVHGFGANGAMQARLLLNRAVRGEISSRSEPVESVIEGLQNAKRPHALLLEDLARECNRDPAHLGRRIIQETGFSYREWRTGYVMRRAAQALAMGRASMSEIAWDVGFEHLSGFDRDFHATFKVTPSQFRQLCQLFAVAPPDSSGSSHS